MRFADAMTAVIDSGERVFLEVGPHPVLSGNIKEILLRTGATGTSIGTLKRDADDRTSVRTALADLYVAGALDTDRAPGASDTASRRSARCRRTSFSGCGCGRWNRRSLTRAFGAE